MIKILGNFIFSLPLRPPKMIYLFIYFFLEFPMKKIWDSHVFFRVCLSIFWKSPFLQSHQLQSCLDAPVRGFCMVKDCTKKAVRCAYLVCNFFAGFWDPFEGIIMWLPVDNFCNVIKQNESVLAILIWSRWFLCFPTVFLQPFNCTYLWNQWTYFSGGLL